jgi:CheY-like chemotaxis protein
VAEQLAVRVEALARSRADLMAAADAERRRIERDLHDGAQQRLVHLAMNLGMARESLRDLPEPARLVIEQAHDEATAALTSLREFVRGLHPAVMNDRGLDAALSGIVATSPVPVRLTVRVEPRCSASIEAIAYFTVSEALTNIAKHASARSASVSVARSGGPAAHRGHRRRPRGRHPGARLRTDRPRAAGRRGGWDDDRPQSTRRDRPSSPWSCRASSDRRGLGPAAGGPDPPAVRRRLHGRRRGRRRLRATARRRAEQPDLVVVDVRMPPTHTDEGIQAALVIRRQYPAVAVLVLSQYVEERYATDLLSAQTSGVGYLLKDRVAHVSDFLDALRRVAAGGTALDPEVVAQLLVRRRDDPLDRLDAARAGGAAAHGRGPVQQRHRGGACGSARARWRSTSAASSPSWTCRPRIPTTAGCWPV